MEMKRGGKGLYERYFEGNLMWKQTRQNFKEIFEFFKDKSSGKLGGTSGKT